jgi:hypothetical protein
MIYVFYFKNDSKREPIGRVQATSLDEARDLISEMKALSEKLVDDLFVIKKLDDHENGI